MLKIAMSEARKERSDEWKVVSYVERRYNPYAVASLQPSLSLTWHDQQVEDDCTLTGFIH